MSMSDVIDRAVATYGEGYSQGDFWSDLAMHLEHGYVFSAPTFFVMGRPIRKGAPDHEIFDISHKFDEPDAWMLWLVSGRVEDMLRYLPFPLPYVAWERGGSLRYYELTRLGEYYGERWNTKDAKASKAGVGDGGGEATAGELSAGSVPEAGGPGVDDTDLAPGSLIDTHEAEVVIGRVT